jgi:hypothetical protein
MRALNAQIEEAKEAERRARFSEGVPVVPGVLAGIVTPEDEKRAADRSAAEEAERKRKEERAEYLKGPKWEDETRKFPRIVTSSGGRRKTLRTKFDHCVKAVRKTVKARKGSNKESAAIAICTKTILHPRGRTLKRYRKGRLLTQKKMRGGTQCY